MINIFVSIIKKEGKWYDNGNQEQTRHVNNLPEYEHINISSLPSIDDI